MYQGQPQKFGTQCRLVNGRYVMWAVDPATTDAERAAWHVKPLAELLGSIICSTSAAESRGGLAREAAGGVVGGA